MTAWHDESAADPTWSSRPIGALFRLLAVFGVLVIGLYAIACYWLVPRLIQTQALPLINQYFTGSLSARHVAFDPFDFTTHLQGLAVKDEYGDLLASATDLVVDLEPLALLEREIKFERIHLRGLWFDLIREEGGGVNLARLFYVRTPVGSAATARVVAPYRLKVDELTLSNGMARVTDNRDLTTATVELLPISFTVRNLTTETDAHGSSELQMAFADGGHLSWYGDIALRPLRAVGRLQVRDLPVGLPWRFLRDELLIDEPSGRLDLAGRIQIEWRDSESLLTVSDLQAQASGLKMRLLDAPEPFLRIAQVNLHDGQYQLADNAFSAAELRINGLSANLELRGGETNWQTILVHDPVQIRLAKARTAPPLALGIQQIRFKDANLELEDRDRPGSLQLSVAEIESACNDEAKTSLRRDNDRIGCGQLQLKAVEVRQQPPTEDLLALLSLVQIDKDEWVPTERRIELPQVTVEGGRGLLEVLDDGSTNWRDAANILSSVWRALGVDVNVGRLRIADGELDYKDLRLQPALVSKLHGLSASIDDLSTAESRMADVDLRGWIGERGTVKVRGRIDLPAITRNSEFAIQCEDIDMVGLTPYGIGLTGREIEAGRLFLESFHRIENQRLNGEYRIRTEGLSWGTRVRDQERFEVPVELATSLLQDRKGRIAFKFSINGELSDPQFSYAHQVREAVNDQLVKAVAAPFRTLGNELGVQTDGLAEIAFAIGGTELTPTAREKLAIIARLLQRRSGVQLVIETAFARQRDATELQRQVVNRALAERLEIPAAPDEAAPMFDFGEQRVQQAIEGLYIRQRGLPAWIEVNRQIPVDESPEARYSSLHARLVASEPLPKNALKQLAIRRAQAIVDTLTSDGGVAMSRIRREAPVEVSDSMDSDEPLVAVKLGLTISD